MITKEEIKNLEECINAAVKQSSFLILSCAMTPEQNGVFSIKGLLETNDCYAQALKTIEKLKEQNGVS